MPPAPLARAAIIVVDARSTSMTMAIPHAVAAGRILENTSWQCQRIIAVPQENQYRFQMSAVAAVPKRASMNAYTSRYSRNTSARTSSSITFDVRETLTARSTSGS